MSKTITLPGLHSPSAGFDEPFEVLAGCHDRVRRSLALLQRLVGHVTGLGPDPKALEETPGRPKFPCSPSGGRTPRGGGLGGAQKAAGDVLRYFDLAAPAHHEDEERHVLPLLIASADPVLVAAAERLLRDHEAIRGAWQALRPALQEIAEHARCADTAALATAARCFVQVHEGHLELEDDIVFPAAARLHPEPAEMGREMARRRGVALP